MKKQKLSIIIVSIITIIIIVGIIISNSNQEVIGIQIEEKWNESGPFSIDKTEYNLGDKIFIDVIDLSPNDKGIMTFYRPLNDTHSTMYIELPFDGSKINNWNKYFEPGLWAPKGICSGDDLAGKWGVKILGTEYSNIKFEILNQTNSWDKRSWEPVC